MENLNKEQIEQMVGVHGGHQPKLSITGAPAKKPMGEKRGIPGSKYYVGRNFGEYFHEENYQQVVASLGSSRRKVSDGNDS